MSGKYSQGLACTVTVAAALSIVPIEFVIRTQKLVVVVSVAVLSSELFNPIGWLAARSGTVSKFGCNAHTNLVPLELPLARSLLSSTTSL